MYICVYVYLYVYLCIYIYIYIIFFRFFSIIVYDKIMNMVSYAIQ